MKVLAYCPLGPGLPGQPRIYARTLTSALSLIWESPIDVVLGKEDLSRAGDTADKYKNVCAKYQRARRLALDGGYDALFTFENDMILPKTTLLRLANIDTDVAYGLYVSRHGSKKWLAFDWIEEQSGQSISDGPAERRHKLWGSVFETAGVGLGCTLIYRHVLEAIDFRLERSGSFHAANDWLFSLDLIRGGFTQKHDLGVVCGHLDGDKSVIYWPDPVDVYKVEPLGPKYLRPRNSAGEEIKVNLGINQSVELIKDD